MVNLTWEQAEAMFPGCSAEWDVTSSLFSGTWEIEKLYENARYGLTVLVRSTDPDTSFGEGRPGGAADPPGDWAHFSYGPGKDELRWGRI